MVALVRGGGGEVDGGRRVGFWGGCESGPKAGSKGGGKRAEGGRA